MRLAPPKRAHQSRGTERRGAAAGEAAEELTTLPRAPEVSTAGPHITVRRMVNMTVESWGLRCTEY